VCEPSTLCRHLSAARCGARQKSSSDTKRDSSTLTPPSLSHTQPSLSHGCGCGCSDGVERDAQRDELHLCERVLASLDSPPPVPSTDELEEEEVEPIRFEACRLWRHPWRHRLLCHCRLSLGAAP
jgi:hypothetical protein